MTTKKELSTGDLWHTLIIRYHSYRYPNVHYFPMCHLCNTKQKKEIKELKNMRSIMSTRTITNTTRRSVYLVERNNISILSTTCSLHYLCMAAHLMYIKLFVTSSWMKQLLLENDIIFQYRNTFNQLNANWIEFSSVRNNETGFIICI